jgi:hypothetical protein
VNTWKVILATLVIFGAGVVTGGLLVTYSHRALQPPRRAAEGARRPGAHEKTLPPLNSGSRKEFLDRLDRELHLSREQREHIAAILRQGQQRTHDLWQAEMIVTRQKIRAQLEPGQQARFQELLKRLPAHARAGTNAPPPVPSTNAPANP